MGKVKQAVRCVRQPGPQGAEWVIPPNPTVVAVKQLYKVCIARGVTVHGHRVKENPMQEVGVLLHLSGLADRYGGYKNGPHASSSSQYSPAVSSASASVRTPTVFPGAGAGPAGSTPSVGGGTGSPSSPGGFIPGAAGQGHPNVLRLLDLMEDNDCLYIVLEYLGGGELFDAVEHRQVNEEKAKRYFAHMVAGSRYMHAMGVGHRDISLENAMLDLGPEHPSAMAKIIDFGLAVKFPSTVGASSSQTNATAAGPVLLPADGRVGKERYMPPEVFNLQQYNPVAVDTWELGVSLFVLLFGVYPYTQANGERCPYFKALADGLLPQLMREWGFDRLVSPHALHLLAQLLQADPAKRPSLDSVLQHPWLAGVAGGGAAPGTTGGATLADGYVVDGSGRAAAVAVTKVVEHASADGTGDVTMGS